MCFPYLSTGTPSRSHFGPRGHLDFLHSPFLTASASRLRHSLMKPIRKKLGGKAPLLLGLRGGNVADPRKHSVSGQWPPSARTVAMAPASRFPVSGRKHSVSGQWPPSVRTQCPGPLDWPLPCFPNVRTFLEEKRMKGRSLILFLLGTCEHWENMAGANPTGPDTGSGHWAATAGH